MSAAGETRWGWHQLADRPARRLVARSGVGPGDFVLDIGAGTGAITRHLVAAGARVVAFELHPGRAAALRERFAGCGAVKVVRADASDLWLPRSPFRVVANPPFAITTAIVRRLISRHSRMVRADLVVPVHAAQRWRRDRSVGARFAIRVGAAVAPGSFSPPGPPAVVLTIESRQA